MNKQELAEGGVAAEGLSRAFGAERAVVDVDLVAQPGEVHAVIGLNGAGKTTLMRLLLGMLLRPDSGRALILGHDVRQADREVFSHVGHLIEARSGYPELTATENLQAAARLYGLNRAAGGLAAERLIEQLLLTRRVTARRGPCQPVTGSGSVWAAR